jgi:hypothetical protein
MSVLSFIHSLYCTSLTCPGYRIQMELDSRKHEAKNELKRQDIVIEVSHHTSLLAVVHLVISGGIKQMACHFGLPSNRS